jgi:transposase
VGGRGQQRPGRPLAQRLLADGEHVVDVPAKLSARAGLFDTGHNRKTDAHDAHAVAVVAVRPKTLRVLSYDAELEVLRMLVDRRDELAKAKVQAANRLQRLLSELVPGQGKKDITALQAKAILAGVRPRDVAGKTRKRLALEQLAEMVAIQAKMKASSKELKVLVLARGSHLMDLTGTAPLDASSGEQIRHRLSRAGNRKANHVIHIAAVNQIRLDTPGRAYYRRKLAAGKTRSEAMRCLKRRISDAIYRQLRADALAATTAEVEAGPGGHRGASHESSAAGFHPHTGTSDQPLPGPAPTTLPPTTPTRKIPATRPLQPTLDNRGEPQRRGSSRSPRTPVRAGMCCHCTDTRNASLMFPSCVFGV